MTKKVDVVIIGAGPAGLSAAIEAAQAGLSVTVIDEYFRPGGRLLGQLYEDPKAPKEHRVWNGQRVAAELADRARKQGVEVLCSVTAWSGSQGCRIHLSGSSERDMEAQAVLLATGAIERAVPLPGWTLPGVISIGAAQTFTNVHHAAVGQRVMVVGIDPLSISIALEMQSAGINVVGVALPPKSLVNEKLANPVDAVKRLAQVSEFAPNGFLRVMGKLAAGKLSKFSTFVLRLNLLRVKDIPIFLRKSVTLIEGTNRVESVILQPVSVDGTSVGVPQQVPVDAVCLSGGLNPLVDLAQVVGCTLQNIPELGGIVPLHGPDMSTTVPGLFVAGNITGIENAKVAIAQGRLAGISIAQSLGKRTVTSVEKAMKEVAAAREASSFTFLPNIQEGRAKMNQLWEEARKDGGRAWTI